MKWTIGTKIGGGFGLVLAILLILGVVTYQSTTGLIDSANARRRTYDVLAQMTEILSLMKDVHGGQRGYALTGEDDYLEPYRAALGSIDAGMQTLRRLTVDNPRQQQRLGQIEPLIKERLALAREAIDVRRNDGLEAAVARAKTGRGKESMDDIREVFAEMEREEDAILADRVAAADAEARRAQWTILLGTLGALSIGAFAGIALTRNIAGPLQSISAVADRIATGDLSGDIEASPRRDEVGVLVAAFARMSRSLRGMAEVAARIAAGELRQEFKPQSEMDMLGLAFVTMIENLRDQTRKLVEGANVLGSAAGEIVASTAQLASSAAESAAAVSETTTTVEEVRQTAQVASQKAKYVSDSAQKAAQTAQNGRRSTDEMSAGMVRIRQQMEAIAASMVRLSEQTQAIGLIIATVEDLAAQSNLLAVNAGIEAAKAGEHGKGFTVVAQEVRSLAEQSRQATTQVRTILSDIQKASTAAVMATEQGAKAVEAGERQTTAAGDSIQALATGVTEAAQAATQIAASSQQQLVGVDQVAVAMENIKQASAQNVASARQLETAARNLDELGRRLKQIVARYQT